MASTGLTYRALHQAALAEALRRAKLSSTSPALGDDPQATDDRAGAPLDSSRPSDLGGVEGEADLATIALAEPSGEHLVQRLVEANAVNDARRNQIVEALHGLRKHQRGARTLPKASDPEDDGQEEILREREVQLAALDFEIKALEQDHSLPPALPAVINYLTTRHAIGSSIEQHAELVLRLRQEREEERRGLEADRKLREDLDRMRQGVQLARKRLERRADLGQAEDAERIVRNLRSHLAKTETSLSQLLNTLIATINSLFPDALPADADASGAGNAGGTSRAEARKRAQLRALLDALMNRAWDFPGDPYVSLVDPATGLRNKRYPPEHVELLIRAGIALEHPRDARRLRLVPFQN